MSKWAQRRKRNILIGIGVILLLIFLIVFFTASRKKASCFDGIKNGTETGIDCGGSCTKVCEAEARNLVVWWERPFKVSKGVYNVVAYFENQNLDAGIKKLPYEFRLYDHNNILVAKPRRGLTWVEPNRRSAIFESGIKTGEKEAYTAFFKILAPYQWVKTDPSFSYNLFHIGSPELSEQDTSPKVSAQIKNESSYYFRDLPVVVILYNKRGNAIAASRTYIDDLAPGAEAEVHYSWPQAFDEPVSRIEIIPRVNPFSSLNTQKK